MQENVIAIDDDLYFLIIARLGTNWETIEEQVHRSHTAEITRLAELGHVVLELEVWTHDRSVRHSCIIARFPSRAELDGWLARAPYSEHGAWIDTEVQQCRLTLPIEQWSDASEAEESASSRQPVQFVMIGEPKSHPALLSDSRLRSEHDEVRAKMVGSHHLLSELATIDQTGAEIQSYYFLQFNSTADAAMWVNKEPLTRAKIWSRNNMFPCMLSPIFMKCCPPAGSFAPVGLTLSKFTEDAQAERITISSGCNAGRLWNKAADSWGYGSGRFEPSRMSAIEALIRSGDCVWDIGANRGYVSLLASTCVGPKGRVYACEPSEVNLPYLRQHVEWNNASNTAVVPYAVSNFNGEANFGYATGMEICLRLDDGDERVQVRSISSLISEDGLQPPTFMKIDVEGAEYEVLAGAGAYLSNRSLIIVLSYHSADLYASCAELLKSNGFTVYLPESADKVDLATLGDADLLAVGPDCNLSAAVIQQFKSIVPYE